MILSLDPIALPGGYGEALLPLDAAKLHLRVDGDEDDTIIAFLRDAAIDAVERYANVRLGEVEAVARFEGFGPAMRLGWGPAATVVAEAVSYIDSTGSPIDLVDGDWRVGLRGDLLPGYGKSWPVSAGPVTVGFKSGFQAGRCPPILLQAVRMMLGTLYEKRDALMTEGIAGYVPLGVVIACNGYREGPGL